MRPLTLVAVVAALAVALPADAQRGGRGGGGGGGGGPGFGMGGGGRPVAAYPGAKPSMGGGWGGGQGGWSGRHGGWSGQQGGWSGRHSGWNGQHGGWSGRHGGHWQGGRYHGHYYGHRHYYGSSYYVGLGWWPYWGWGWSYPAYPYNAYRGYWYPSEGPVYVNPDPMPAYGEPAFRWYCPASAAYHPDVRECAQPWLKVAPADGSGPPPEPIQDSAPAESPTTSVPDAPTVVPGAEPAAATAGRVRIAAPRMTSPAEIASRRALQNAVAQSDLH